ncbi:MAG: siphovirus Gp157 family protein [Bacteroidales bacterium]|nr:siphovirus Gp157 family protein [Bacteroidales bacterium]
MASLYEISQDLIVLFGAIEEQEGEMTDEQCEALQIGEENLKEKLEAYRRAVVEFKGAVEVCKAEAKRIADRKKTMENRVNRLTEAMRDAVVTFGQEGKNGVRYIDLESSKLSTRTTKRTVVEGERVQALIEAIDSAVKSGKLDKTEKVEDIVNALPSDIGVTAADLNTMEIRVVSKYTVADWILNHRNAVKDYSQNASSIEIENVTGATEWKEGITSEGKITLAHIDDNVGLTIN